MWSRDHNNQYRRMNIILPGEIPGTPLFLLI